MLPPGAAHVVAAEMHIELLGGFACRSGSGCQFRVDNAMIDGFSNVKPS